MSDQTSFTPTAQRSKKIALKSHKVWRYVSKKLNSNLSEIANLSIGSTRKIIWFCDNLHIFEAAIRDRATRGRICKYCTGYGVALPYFNDMFSTNPILEYLWDYDKNTINPRTLKKGSQIKVWWKCSNGHSFSRHPNEMTNTYKPLSEKYSGCSFCSNRRLLVGFNDLSTVDPNLAREWDYERNLLHPTDIHSGYQGDAYWICSKNHSWKSSVNSRRDSKRGCPYCANQKLLNGYNDSFTLFPEIMSDWSELNQVDPRSIIGKGADQYFWWDCKKCNMAWKAKIYSKLERSQCSNCAPNSKLEQIVYEEVSRAVRCEILRNRRPLKDPTGRLKYLELDIWIPSLNIAFEIQDDSTHSKNDDYELMSSYWGKMTGEAYKKGPRYHELKRNAAIDQLETHVYDIWESEIKDGTFIQNVLNILGDIEKQ